MSSAEEDAADLAAAVSVWAATLELDSAIADLAARPLDEDTADRMRALLASSDMEAARGAMRRLEQRQPTPRRRRLSVVGEEDCSDEESEESDAEATVPCAGGVV